jgi:hypothetical protein
MGIVIKSKRPEDEREPIPPGNYLGVITGVYDIGTQDGRFGKMHQIITFTELHKKHGPAVDSKGRPFAVSTFYNLSFFSGNGKTSNLRADVETITGHVFTDEQAERDGFDIETLVGQAYRLTLVENVRPDGKTRPKVSSCMALDEDDPKPESQTDHVYFELDDQTIRSGKLYGIPKWIAKFIERSAEWVAVHGAPKPDGNGSAPSPPGAVDESDVVPY